MPDEKGRGKEQEKSAWELKADQERRAFEDLKKMYALQDKDAVQGMEKFHVVEDYFKDIQGKMSRIQETKKELEEAIERGDNRSTDLGTKVKFEDLASKARNLTLEAFTQPETPERVKIEQGALERTSHRLEGEEQIKSTERVVSVLGGESLDNIEVPPNERLILSEAEMLTKNKELSSKVLSLRNEISASLERLKGLGPELEKIAESKMLPESEKEEKLKQYEEQYKNYEKLRKDLLDTLHSAK